MFYGYAAERNALYFINGDVPWYGSRILQEALDLHKDKKVLPISFLAIPAYRDALCQSLGIKPFEAKENYDSIDNLYHEVLEYIINKSKRPAYFSPHFNSSQADDFPLKLYNEGLVFRYSAKRYDNMAVAQRNVEEKYHLEYLLEPLYVNEEQSADHMQEHVSAKSARTRVSGFAACRRADCRRQHSAEIGRGNI